MYDLLNARKRLEIREDARKKVCIVGLKDFRISNVSQSMMAMLEVFGAQRTCLKLRDTDRVPCYCLASTLQSLN